MGITKLTDSDSFFNNSEAMHPKSPASLARDYRCIAISEHSLTTLEAPRASNLPLYASASACDCERMMDMVTDLLITEMNYFCVQIKREREAIKSGD